MFDYVLQFPSRRGPSLRSVRTSFLPVDAGDQNALAFVGGHGDGEAGLGEGIYRLTRDLDR